MGLVSTLIEQDREEPGNYRCQAEILRAMSHPLRLRLLTALARGPACVSELVEWTGCRQPCVSQSLATLRKAGLVISMREGMTVCYRLACPDQMEHFLAEIRASAREHAEFLPACRQKEDACSCT